MESQLKDRYLKDNDCEHGIYVVGLVRLPFLDRQRFSTGEVRQNGRSPRLGTFLRNRRSIYQSRGAFWNP